jgi:hypothetical protein
MMQDHLEKFPEKPLHEVENSFNNQNDIDSEKPTKLQKERAFNLYKEVLER